MSSVSAHLPKKCKNGTHPFSKIYRENNKVTGNRKSTRKGKEAVSFGDNFKEHYKARVRQEKCMDISQMKPVHIHEEGIWKDNYLPTETSIIEDILIPTEIHMHYLKGKRENLGMFYIRYSNM